MTPNQVKETWDFNPETGEVRWKIHPSKKIRAGSIAGSDDGRGYWKVRFRKRNYYLHILMWVAVYGRWPTNDIDHVNGTKSDIRIINLREATRAQNVASKPVRRDSLTGRKGVTLDKRDGYYYPYVDFGGKRRSLGRFTNLDDAHAARLTEEKKLYGEFSWDSNGDHPARIGTERSPS